MLIPPGVHPGYLSRRVNDDLKARLARALGQGYEVRDALGRGGFAIVYAAFDLALKREVAVKVLRPELSAEPSIRQRFRREAEAVARLRHAHIVPIYSVGESGDLAWYVMPFIAGPTLRARLERTGPLPVDEARRILLEAATALGVAHRAGLVHRDIKPDNILLDGDDARVLLTDFGIAKAIADQAPGRGLTETGVVIGTPQYMSPEQASGEPTDVRSDVYSLGVVAYQMLAGSPPFDAGTVAALLVQQMVAEAPSVIRKRPDCPSDLAAAVMRCLAKAPEQRWASVDDLRRALAPPATVAAAIARTSGTARAPSLLAQFRRVSIGAVLALAACLAVDVARGTVLLGPLGFLLGAFVVATLYGRLWTAGYGWREVLGQKPGGGAGHSPVPLDSAEFGPHAAAIHRARADRAALRARLERVPRAERRPYEAVVSAADAILARAAVGARQLVALERQIEPGPEELERRIAATAGEPPSPGRAQRLAVLERRRNSVQGLIEQRDAAVEAFTRSLTALARLRAAVENPAEIADAVREATASLG
jgi:tRNA A-37 threonylcarbamoyl transferase component Bud32